MSLQRTVGEFWDNKALHDLMEYIRIPAKSTAYDRFWESHGYLTQCCELGKNWVKENVPQARTEIIQEKGKTPCLFIDIPASNGATEESVVFYGHLDKQPEAGGWREGLGPWTPVVEKGKLYGRGAADDGYSLFSMITAVHALEHLGMPHPRIIGIFETQEESGSNDLPYFLNKFKDKFGSPKFFIILDNHCGDYEHVWLSTSLRGIISGTLRVQSMHYGVHSGTYSGMVPDPFAIAQALIARLHDPISGLVKISSCYANIPQRRIDQLKKASDVLGDLVWNHAPLLPGVQTKCTTNHEILIQETWKPALTVIGMDGLPRIEDAGNVIQSSVALRLSMRLPPDIDFEKAEKDIASALTENIPYGCQVTWQYPENHPGWSAKDNAQTVEDKFNEAAKEIFGKEAVFLGQGGSISIINTFEELFPGSAFILTGVLGPQSNAHAPDESLDLEYTKKLTAVIARVISLSV